MTRHESLYEISENVVGKQRQAYFAAQVFCYSSVFSKYILEYSLTGGTTPLV